MGGQRWLVLSDSTLALTFCKSHHVLSAIDRKDVETLMHIRDGAFDVGSRALLEYTQESTHDIW